MSAGYFSTAVMQMSMASSFISAVMSVYLTRGYLACRKKDSMSMGWSASVIVTITGNWHKRSEAVESPEDAAAAVKHGRREVMRELPGCVRWFSRMIATYVRVLDMLLLQTYV
jgi:hypothetical protein